VMVMCVDRRSPSAPGTHKPFAARRGGVLSRPSKPTRWPLGTRPAAIACPQGNQQILPFPCKSGILSSRRLAVTLGPGFHIRRHARIREGWGAGGPGSCGTPRTLGTRWPR
jgi:hypothetical protein